MNPLVIGGGPAGATAARLLAQWGHDVELRTTPRPGRALAECLPPSTKKVFRFLGIADAIEAAGFFPTTGNTVWWGARGRRVEPYPEGSGYQVDRGTFDGLLLEQARAAGAAVRIERVAAGSLDCTSNFVIDCSGRAGLLARRYRSRPRGRKTVALCGVWRSERGWHIPDPSHTLVESYGDSWAWSVPLSPTVRHVAFMVNAAAARGGGVAQAYAAELDRTRAFRRIFARGRMDGAPWGRDSSPYSARHFAGPGFVLAGDAGWFLDPLSSFGVKKAIVSGWTAAVVVNTCLRRPAMAGTALQFFDQREREIEAHYTSQTERWLDVADPKPAGPGLRLAFEQIKASRSLRFTLAPGVDTAQRAGIEGNEVVLRDALIAPGMTSPLDYVANVNVAKLAGLAPGYRQVPDLFEAYNRACTPVELPDFLRALATLVSERLLIPAP